MTKWFASTVALAALLGGAALAADLKSGLQPGERVKAFNPFNVTGASAGEARCQV